MPGGDSAAPRLRARTVSAPRPHRAPRPAAGTGSSAHRGSLRPNPTESAGAHPFLYSRLMPASTAFSFYLTNFQTLLVFFSFSFADTRFGCYSNPEQTTLCCISPSVFRAGGVRPGCSRVGSAGGGNQKGFLSPPARTWIPSTVLRKHCFSALPLFLSPVFQPVGTSAHCAAAALPKQPPVGPSAGRNAPLGAAGGRELPAAPPPAAWEPRGGAHTHSPKQELSTCGLLPAAHILGQKPGFCAGFTGALHNRGPALPWRLLRAIATHVNNNNN